MKIGGILSFYILVIFRFPFTHPMAKLVKMKSEESTVDFAIYKKRALNIKTTKFLNSSILILQSSI
jgi:hypothetical protein